MWTPKICCTYIENIFCCEKGFVCFLHRDMTITLESYCKRAAALRKKEPNIPKRFNYTHDSYNRKAIELVPVVRIIGKIATNLINFSIRDICSINITHAISKVQWYSADSVKSWQSYNDTRMGVQWTRRSMVRAIILILKWIRISKWKFMINLM